MKTAVSIVSMPSGCSSALESVILDSRSNGISDCIVIGHFFGFGSDLDYFLDVASQAKVCLATGVDQLLFNRSVTLNEIPVSNTIQRRILKWVNSEIQRDPNSFADLFRQTLPFCYNDIVFPKVEDGLLDLSESKITDHFQQLHEDKNIMVSVYPCDPFCVDSNGLIIEDPLAVGKIKRQPDTKYLISPGFAFSTTRINQARYVSITDHSIEFRSTPHEIENQWEPFLDNGVLEQKDLDLLKRHQQLFGSSK